jgi:16S rRNA (guanine966-N2)-methyltransferase
VRDASTVDAGDRLFGCHDGSFTPVRVVAGTAGGRALSAPVGHGTRPTAERVREALFSMLASMDVVEGARVIDLFAGSGALGIEAISRGAESVVFVDDDPLAVAAIRSNLGVLGADASKASVVQTDVTRFLSSAPKADLVFVDPPYGFGEWSALLRLLEDGVDIVVAETPDPLEPGAAWETVKHKRYGGTLVTIVQRVFAPVEGSRPEAGEEGES